MSDEPFLARWARRKRDAAKDDAATGDDAARGRPDANLAGEASQPLADAKKESAEDAAFDPASLPPIDSIVSGTDIRAFLAKNVPAELKRAALRRVWVADPAIRDFVGLAENDWDFTKPDSMRGFGELDPDFDVEAMVRRVIGDPSASRDEKVASAPAPSAGSIPEEEVEQVARAGPAQSEGTDVVEPNADQPAPSAVEQGEDAEIVRRNTPAAAQTQMTLSNNRSRRQHGGALPQQFTNVNRDS